MRVDTSTPRLGDLGRWGGIDVECPSLLDQPAEGSYERDAVSVVMMTDWMVSVVMMT